MKRCYQSLMVVAAMMSCQWISIDFTWAQSSDKVEQELIRIQNEWATARIKGDVPYLEKLYAKEFRVSAINGTVVTREADIAVFANRDMKPEIIEDTDMQVSIYGQVAMVTGLEHVKGTYKGYPGDFMIRFTNVFVHREGRWQMITHHGTEVPKK